MVGRTFNKVLVEPFQIGRVVPDSGKAALPQWKTFAKVRNLCEKPFTRSVRD